MRVLGEGAGPIRYEGLIGEVTNRLREAILAGRLGDGDRIVERDVAAELGVSRGPIRDALKQLEHEGLVELQPRRGARVATLTLEDAAEVLGVRGAIEPLAVELLLRGDDPPAALEALERCVDRLGAAGEQDAWAALVSLDMEFHEQLYRSAGNRRLLRIWGSMRGPLLQTFRIHREFYDSADAVFRSHRELLDVISAGRVDVARQATHDHVLDLRPQLFERLSRADS